MCADFTDKGTHCLTWCECVGSFLSFDTGWVKTSSPASSHILSATLKQRVHVVWWGGKKEEEKGKRTPPFPSFFHSGDSVDTAPCSAISLSSSFSFSLFIGSFSSVCLQRRQAESILWNVMWKLLWSHASYINHQNDIFWKEAIALLTIVPQKVIKDRENFTTAFMSLFKSNTDPENTMVL